MRILYYIPGPTYGGAHNQVVRLAEPLRAAGYEPVALLPDEPGDGFDRLQAAGIEVHKARLHRLRATRRLAPHWQLASRWAPQLRYLDEFLRDHRIEMVQVHGVTNVDGAIAASRRGLPLVWQILDTRAPRPLRTLTAPLVQRYADSVLTTGTTVGSIYPGLDRLGSRVVPYYPPVDGREFAPADPAARQAVRTALGVAADEILVGDLGNLNAQKGHQYVVEAVGLVRRSLPQVTLRVRGGRAPGHEEYQASVERLAASHGLPVQTVGSLPAGMSARDFLGALDLFALGSEPRSEGVPTVIIEAMLTGVPVVATDVGGVAEAVRDGDTGFVVPPRDAAALADRIGRLAEDPQLRAAMAQRSRGVASAELSLEACVQAYRTAYQAAIEHRRARPAR
jgi:glycosyltransferase involved in cell wall biosynthesis